MNTHLNANPLISFLRLTLITGVFTCLAALGLSSSFGQTYTVTDLGVLPDKKESVPCAINNLAQVAGISGADPSTETAFRYNNGSKAPLEDLGRNVGGVSRGLGINDASAVVGDSSFFSKGGAVRRAALFINGAVADLGTLKKAGSFSRANGINGNSQVVGFSGPELDSEKSRAFLWTKAAGITDLGTLGGLYAQATAINDAGFVTGNSRTGTDRAGQIVHAFLYQLKAAKAMRDLGTLGGSYSYGTSISADNHVVGYSTLNDVDGRVHAFMHDGTSMRDLGSLTGASGRATTVDQSVALGINMADQVVGYSYLPDGQGGARQVAIFYSQGVMTDLNTLIGRATKSQFLYSATAINDKGQIVAEAIETATGTSRAVLLTPADPVEAR